VVGVNYGDSPAQCFVRLPYPDLGGRVFLLRDLLNPGTPVRA
jgi:hypothetical protein